MGIRLKQCRQRVAELEAQVADLQAQQAANEVVLADRNEQIVVLKAKIADYLTEIASLQGQLATTTEELAAVQAALNECLNPTPPPPTTTLFGVTVTGGVRKNMPDLHDDVQVSRVFSAGTTSWANEGQHKQFPNGKWAVSNSYALSEANLPKYLATIPDADKAKIVGYADGHELEHPDKGLRPADVKARVKRTAPVIRAAGLTVTWCMMGYSLRNDDWLQWVDPDDVDLLAFDKYNSGAKKNPPVYQTPADMVRQAVAASERFGKPWAFWETGTNNFEKPYPAGATQAQKDAIDEANRQERARRVAWAKGLRAEIIKTGGKQAIWFDRPSTSGSDWDATLDRPTAEAWLGLA